MKYFLKLHVWFFSAIFFLFPTFVFAATLSIAPATVSVNAGDTITQTIFVSSTDESINAVSGTLSFPPDMLSVSSVSKASSILTLWVQEPAFSSGEGSVTWSGVVPNPGFLGAQGRILSIQFRAKKTGTATLEFSSSAVLANDGSGTNVLTATRPATITVTSAAPVETPAQPQTQTPAPVITSQQNVSLLADITSSTHPDQTKWYGLAHVVLDWTNAQGVTAVRLGYDRNADGTPTVLYSDPLSHKELQLDDGIWYFHVKEKNAGGWGPTSTFKIQIDTAPPIPIDIQFPNGTTTQESTIAVEFTTSDELSGIDHYELLLDGKKITISAQEGSSTYALHAEPGTHTLAVSAYDKAGNTVTSQASFGVEGSTSSVPSSFFAFGWLAANYASFGLIAIGLLASLLFIFWYMWTHFHAYRHKLHKNLGINHARVHNEFDRLREALSEEIVSLERVKTKRALTAEEERFASRFKKLLDKAERTIEKELDAVAK